MRKQLSRRTVLRGAGVALALPFLESVATAQESRQPKRRLVAVNIALGLHSPYLIPTQAGRNYELTPYLKTIGSLRDHFTVISGATHPNLTGGHSADLSYLSAAPNPGTSAFKNSISIDQLVARELGRQTRFAYLALSDQGNSSSISASGVRIPAQTSPSKVFSQLFLESRPSDKARRIAELKEGQSILDVVLEKSKRLRTRISKTDQQKLDEYLAAVRETENRLVKSEEWENRPKPKVSEKPLQDVRNKADTVALSKVMYDLMFLAVQTDSTRVLTYTTTSPNAVPAISGVSLGYHNLSHHGKDPDKLKQLSLVEQGHMNNLNTFLTKLQNASELGATLLDRTMVMFGSHMGNASSHNNTNLPVILAGGGFRHGQHLAFDSTNNYPLPNMFVSMLQRLGLEHNRFASSTGTMRGLEFSG